MGLFIIGTIVFIIVSVIMILIILVQRPQGGGLAGAFGGSGGGSADTVFGGRVGDALTAMTVGAFVLYLLLALGLNILDNKPAATAAAPAAATQPGSAQTPVSTTTESIMPVPFAMPGATSTNPGPGLPVTAIPVTGPTSATPAQPSGTSSGTTAVNPAPATGNPTPGTGTPDPGTTVPPAESAPPATAPSAGGSNQ